MFPTAAEGLSRYHTPLQAEDIDLETWRSPRGKRSPRACRTAMSIWRAITRKKLAACLERMTECLEQGAVLFHCSAGKDRTDVAASAPCSGCAA